MKLAFKIDVDTYQGTKVGVENFRRFFGAEGIRPTFLFSLGKDQMGRSIFRVFKKGFIRKCLKSNVAGNYGVRTLLYGTLLPSPVISKKCGGLIKAVSDDGFECGVHSWNHYYWQNKLFKLSPEQVRAEFMKAYEALKELTGKKCATCGSPAWQVSEPYLEVEDELGLDYASDVRGSSAFNAEMGGRFFKTLQIPSTLYTLDEVLCDRKIGELADLYTKQILSSDFSVMTIHAELEGAAYFEWFKDFVRRLKSIGVEFVNLGDYAKQIDRSKIPTCRITMDDFYNRSGRLAVQGQKCT